MQRLRSEKPGRVWIVADGPKPEGGAEETQACLAARREAEGGVTWPCQIRKVYAGQNLGLRMRVETGLDTVFAEETAAAILEEDCQPREDFFPFVRSMLGRYAGEARVGAVSGNCFLPQRVQAEGSYYFSRYFHVWGWATWARAWNSRNQAGHNWPSAGVADLFPAWGRREIQYWNRIYDRTVSRSAQSWAYPWMATQWMQERCFVVPMQNLVVNRGFGSSGTNTRDATVETGVEREGPLRPPYLGPEVVAPDERLDREVFRNHYVRMQGRLGFFARIRRSFRKRVAAWGRK